MSNTFIRRAGIAAALALLLAAGASAETRRITLLGSSDIHGYFVPWDYATDTEYKAGALSKIATAVKRIRAEGAPVIVLDAGDLIQGNFTEKFRNEDKNPMVLGLNAIGYDLWVLGPNGYHRHFKGDTNRIADSGSLPEIRVCYDIANGEVYAEFLNTGANDLIQVAVSSLMTASGMTKCSP